MATRRRRRKKQREGKRPARPAALERAYARTLRGLVRKLKPTMDAALKRLARAARGDALVVDADPDDPRANVRPVTTALAGVKTQFDTLVRRARPGLIVQGIDAKVTRFTVNAVDGSFRGVVSIPPSELEADHKAWIKENVALIKSIPSTLFDQVETVVEEGWSKGRTGEQIARDVAERFSVAESRATLIAVDQVGKLNAKVTEQRHKEIGIESYRWSTSRDERVRGNPAGLYPDADPSHWAREGKVFSYDDPPEDGHPGEPIRCRCSAIPIIPDDFDEADE